MLISIDWLKEFVDFSLTDRKLAEILCRLGLETTVAKEGILDIEITPNRGDCLSVLGIAREIAAKLDIPLTLPEAEVKEASEPLDFELGFSPSAKKSVYRYTFRLIKGLKIAPSPSWIQDKLASYGFRPINNVVDITNLVMIELGLPLHAFDYEKLGGRLFLREAKKGESIITLDGKERKLEEGMLVAEDVKGRLTDLCGIMGGFYSEVDDKTQVIVLQAAVFDPVKIRLASKRLHHQTDASYRYERGVDFNLTELALDRATELILQTAGGKALSKQDLVFKKLKPPLIKFSLSELNRLLGSNFSVTDVKDSLKRLGFEVAVSGNRFQVRPPSFRYFDINFWQDLAEEVLRLQGYHTLKPAPLQSRSVPKNAVFKFKEFVKDELAKRGFVETLSYSFISREDLKRFQLKESELLKIKNPLSLENEYFRPNLLINIVKQIAVNPWFGEIKFFEIGRVADKTAEKEHLIVAIAKKKGESELKEVEKFLASLGLKGKTTALPQDILQSFKIKKPVFFVETELKVPQGSFSFCAQSMPRIKTPSSFPPVQIDLAFIVDADLDPYKVEKLLLAHPRVILVELFDEFVSERFGKNKKNIAFHVWLEHPRKVLRDEEAREIMTELAKGIERAFKAKWRTF